MSSAPAGITLAGAFGAPLCYARCMIGDARWVRRGGWLLAGLGAAVVAWGGCGGKAVIDESGSGGASSSSGSGASPTSTSTSSSGSSTSTSSGAGAGPGSLCMEACAQVDACSVGAGCVAGCQAAMDQCVGQQDSYLMCVIGDSGSGQCGGMPKCAAELQSFLSCKGLSTVGGTCSGGPGGYCSCDASDNQGNTYSSECSGDGGKQTCSCLFDGVPAGKCSFAGPPECDPFYNCCATTFFVPYLPGMIN